MSTVGVVTFQGGSYGVASNSCADVIVGWGIYGRVAFGCSSDPVVVGTAISYGPTSGVTLSNVGIQLVQSITATAKETVAPTSPEGLQAQITALKASDSVRGLQFSTLQTTIGSNGIDPETITASSSLFLAFLLAGVTVYGIKRVLGLFREPGGHE